MSVGLFIVELILMIVVLFLFIQLNTHMADGRNDCRAHDLKQGARRYMKFRLKFLFPALAYMQRKRAEPKNSLKFTNWNPNLICKYAFWFGIINYLIYVSIVAIYISNYVINSVGFADIAGVGGSRGTILWVMFGLFAVPALYGVWAGRINAFSQYKDGPG